MSYSVNVKNIDLMIKTSLLPVTQIEHFDNNILKIEKEEERKKAIYSTLNKYMSIHNLDEIDMFWELFYSKRKLKVYQNLDIYCLDLLKSFARTFLSHRDGRIVFKYWETENNKYFKAYKGISKVLLWHSMNRYFTTDIIGVLYLIDHHMNQEQYLKGYYSRVALEDMQLESILRKGIAETHLHVSAAADFYTSWKNLMNLYNNDPKEVQYHEVIGNKKYELGKYYKVASILRLIMTYFLVKYNNKDVCFSCFVEEIPYMGSDGEEKNSAFYQNPKLNIFIRELLDNDNRKYEEFKEEDLKSIFKVLFEEVFHIYTGARADAINTIQNNPIDILDYLIFDEQDNFESDIQTYTENIFLMKTINYIYNYQQDEAFSNCFMNYLRIKNEFFSFMVQGNEIKGLSNFVKYFDRSTKIGCHQNKSIRWKELLSAQFRDENLKKLEIRISPAKVYKKNKVMRSDIIKKEMCKVLLLILEAYKNILERESIYEDKNGEERYRMEMSIPNLGIIYHFIKKQDLPIEKKCWLNYENETERENLYYEKQKYEYKLQAETILKIRNEIPEISKYIVGIDGASIENYTDPWVFSQVYEELRDGSHSMYGYGMKPLNTLGFTFHAGEDFRHILTGLRRIDETIDRYKYHAGDRIGHGIALGVDLAWWIKNHPVVTMPRMEYLENLIWIWGSCKYSKTSIDMGYLERKIMDYSKEIYINTEGITIYNLWEAYECKFKEFNPITKRFKLKKYREECEDYELEKMVCCPNIDCENGSWDKEKLIRSHHCKKYLERMIEPIQVEVQREQLHIFEEMQKLVLQKVSNKGIIVETNPTSNASIGEIENIFNHYIIRLNNLEGADNNDSLMISINSDDPSVFNTNLSNEFAYIFYSLVERGHSKEKVLNWIDKIRKHGMNSSFIRESCKSVYEVKEELEIIIDKLKERV